MLPRAETDSGTASGCEGPWAATPVLGACEGKDGGLAAGTLPALTGDPFSGLEGPFDRPTPETGAMRLTEGSDWGLAPSANPFARAGLEADDST